MIFRLSHKSAKILDGVHPALTRVLTRALPNSPLDFGISPDSVRSLERQNELVISGKSKTMRSRHLASVIKGWEELGPVSCAADIHIYKGGTLTWEREDFALVAGHILGVAKTEGVPVEWGGHWRGFFDGPHFQLPWADFPKAEVA